LRILKLDVFVSNDQKPCGLSFCLKGARKAIDLFGLGNLNDKFGGELLDLCETGYFELVNFEIVLVLPLFPEPDFLFTDSLFGRDKRLIFEPRDFH